MSRKTAKYKPEAFETKRSSDHFTRLYDSMLESDAFKSLTHAARTVYLILKLQYRGSFTGATVICPYKEFQSYGMNTATVRKALSDLEQYGFIRIEHGTRQYKDSNLKRQPNEYTFSDKWQEYRKDKPP